jgi:hypothetical protein
LYQDALGRPIDASGQAFFSGELAGGRTTQQVAHDVLTSDEYKHVVVNYLYVTYLGRNPDPAGLNSWTQGLNQGIRDEGVLAGILGSDEYFNRIGA